MNLLDAAKELLTCVREKGFVTIKSVEDLHVAVEEAEKQEPVRGMYQSIGVAVLRDNKYQDGYFIADGDEDRICELFYKRLSYHFSITPSTPDGWQPIETAPRDGTVILVYFKRRGAKSVRWEEGVWHVDDHKHGPFPVRGYIDSDVTHWMPLPQPPKEKP